MADRYEAGQPSSSHRQDRNNGAQTHSWEYTLDDLAEYATDHGTKYGIHERILDSCQPELAPLDLNQMPERITALWHDDRYYTGFLRNKSYNISIIDVNTESKEDHISITKLLQKSLSERSGGRREPMVIHIFCYEELKMLTPLYLSIILLQSILKRFYRNPDVDWKSIKVISTRNDKNWREYEITIELLKVLISQILEDHPEETMHFVFSGICPSYIDEEERLSLARFMIEMGQIVRNALPQGDMRMMKCAFSGDGLFQYVFRHLELEKAQRRCIPEQEEIFRQMLMLTFCEDANQNNYYERIRFK